MNLTNANWLIKNFRNMKKLLGILVLSLMLSGSANAEEEKVLHDFYMLDSSRENLDYNFISIQKVVIRDSELLTKWLNK